VKSYESQYKIYNEVVEYGAILDQRHTAAAQIRKALNVALRAIVPSTSRCRETWFSATLID
jgi:hypothetical protein